MENRICNKCKMTLTEEQKFCPYCGTEYVKPKPVCQKCGVVLEEGQKFCHLCGAKNESRCNKCGAELTQNNRFCSNCGEQVKQNTVLKEKIEKIRQDKTFTSSFAKRGVILLLAFLMLISIFLPFTKISYDNYLNASGKIVTIYCKFNVIDGVVLFFDSVTNYETNAEVKESSLYKRTEKLEEKLKEKYGTIEKAVGDFSFNRYMKYEQRLLIRQYVYKTSINYIVGAIVCLAYIIFAIIFFILALVSFLSLFINLPDYEEKTKIAFTVVPIILTVTSLMFDYGKIGAFSIILAVLSITLTILYALYKHFIIEEKAFNKRNTVKRLLTCACCILILFVSVIPLFTAKITAEFSGSTKETTAREGVDHTTFKEFDYYMMYDEEKYETPEPYEIAESAYTSIIKMNTKKEIKEGKADANIINVITFSTIDYAEKTMAWIFNSGTIFVLLSVLAGAVLLWNEILKAVCNISLNKGAIKGAKIASLISTLIIFALVVAISSLSTLGCQSLDLNFKTSVSFGMIAILIASVIVAIKPIENRS